MIPPKQRKALLVSLALTVAVHAAGACASEPLTSTDRLRQLMQQIQPQPQPQFEPTPPASGTVAPASGQGVEQAASDTAAALAQRLELLKAGEVALARRDVTRALAAFERAALILHAADTEISLVRTHMQDGQYQRALAFGAHTAGSHLDAIGGGALYAWLLHVGGQPALAQRVLAGPESRLPGNAFIAAVQQQLRSGQPVATGQLLQAPARLAPYGDATGLPANARVVGSALLLPSGTTALVPLDLLPRSGKLWLRSNLGFLVKASVDTRLSELKVALVRLSSALPAPHELQLTPNDMTPGSSVFRVEHISSVHAEPAWPVLYTGTLTKAANNTENASNANNNVPQQLLDINAPPNPGGGPVFDGSGRLAGLALSAAGSSSGSGANILISVSQLRAALNAAEHLANKDNLAHGATRIALPSEQLAAPDTSPSPGPRPRSFANKAYEASLKTCLQVITAP